MRNMSFAMTTQQIRDRSKTVTRRFGWWTLKPGTLVAAVEKGMSLKKGETVNRLAVIRIVSVRQEPLYTITPEDCAREGFPHMAPRDFTAMLVHHYDVPSTAIVNRIEFEYVDESEVQP